MLRRIYDKKGISEATRKAIFIHTFKNLSKATLEGYYGKSTNIDYKSKDWGLLKELRRNVASFSAFKTHSQIAKTVDLLKDEKGNLRDFKDFEREALKLDSTYNKRYLRVEYNHAVSSARSARRWDDIQRTKNLYPYLTYVAVNDDRTRQLHRQWDGITLPIEHPFWKTHYPPNDWECRCKTKRSKSGINTNGLDVENMPTLPKQFNTNVGENGRVFDESHPYFIDNSKSKKQIERRINTHKNEFPDYTFLSDKKVRVSTWTNALKITDNLRVGSAIVKALGWDVRIRPHLPNFKTGIGDKGFSNPTFLLNNSFASVKQVNSSINSAWDTLQKQGNEIAIFELSEKADLQKIRAKIKERIDKLESEGKKSPFKEIVLLQGTKIETY